MSYYDQHLPPQSHQHLAPPLPPPALPQQLHPSEDSHNPSTGLPGTQGGGQGQVRPLRAMLARGAACDTCRARKVRCDGARPHCSPCLKSARGDISIAQTKCKYEGTSVAAAREAAAAASSRAAAIAGSGPQGQKRKRVKKQAAVEEDGEASGKRSRMVSSEGSLPPDGGDSYDSSSQWQYQQPPPPPQQLPLSSSSYAPYNAHPPHPAPATSTSAPPPPTDVDELTNRVAQLEQRLRLQAENHAAQLASAPHTRSPSFPYHGTYPAPPSSANGQNSAHSSGTFQLPPVAPTLPNSSSAYSLPTQPQRPHTPGSYPPMQLPRSSASSFAPPTHFLPPPPITGASSGFSSSYPFPAPSSSTSSSLLASPRPQTAGSGLNSRTPLPSLSGMGMGIGMLASAAGVGVDDAPSGMFALPPAPATLGSWSPSLVAESHLRGGSVGNGGAPSPASSLRHLISAANGDVEDTSSPRHSLWGITSGSNGGGKEHPSYSLVNTAPAVSTPLSGAFGPDSRANSGSPDGPPAFSLPDEFLTPELYALLHPNYSPTLPPPSILHHLLTAFFARATVPASMFDRIAVMRSLQLGPNDRSWLDEGLLHAMCAYGSFYVSREALFSEWETDSGLGLSTEEDGVDGEIPRWRRRIPYWMKEGDKTARDYHYRAARRSVEDALGDGRGRGRDLFQVLQATILLSYIAYTTSTPIDLWFLSGIATRLCTPLGLNHLDPWNFDDACCGPPPVDWGVRIRFVERREVMSKVVDLDEHWRRAVTFWLAFSVDRWASASTDWSTSIDEKDISTHLPCMATLPMAALRIQRNTGLIPSLNIASPTFLEDTSAPIGSLGLYIKATVLLGRVVNFLQRLPRVKCADAGHPCLEVKEGVKASPEFIELDVALLKFKATHSANFFDASGNQIDGFLASTYAIPHVATILLHEAFCDRLDQSPSSSLARCLAAAKCVVNSIHVLWESSYDLGGCDPFIPFTWSVTGRALVRDWATRRRWADSPFKLDDDVSGFAQEAEASKQLAEHCLNFMETCAGMGSKISYTLSCTLREHLDNPDNLLPIDGSEPWAASSWVEATV